MDKYLKKSFLGRGSSGKVFLVEEKATKRQFAMKVIDVVGENDTKNLQNEINLIKKLAISHPNIAHYEESFYDNIENAFIVLMEYCQGGSLRSIINQHKEAGEKIPEKKVIEYLAQIILALNFIHTQNMIHKNLHPNNILLDDKGRIKITDFEISIALINTKRYALTSIETRYYAAPEVLKGERYTNSVDIWSVGCIAHELCCLTQPYIGINE